MLCADVQYFTTASESVEMMFIWSKCCDSLKVVCYFLSPGTAPVLKGYVVSWDFDYDKQS